MIPPVFRVFFFRSSLILVVALMLALVGPRPEQAAAQGAIGNPVLNMTPETRTARTSILNLSERPRLYSIAVVDMEKDAEGNLRPLTQARPGKPLLAPYMRFSPRRTRLLPRENQTIRIAFRPPADLPPGEYVTYVRIEEQQTAPPKSGGGIKIELRINHLIPIYITHK